MAKGRPSLLPSALRPRLLSLAQGAEYLGISTGKFWELIDADRLPKPRRIERRKVWIVRELDAASDSLPVEGVK